ncbi:polyprotein [Xinzhou spider virus 3]|uniref:polyprotein n=1 Tax=Xinzhou spider virus 3 TaxID=1746074 RepID=UPI000705C36F|nr:polyprotein [Xinzhou spider virus 3]ALL52890.1 polyprotein [Xinzhou spider virus 3]
MKRRTRVTATPPVNKHTTSTPQTDKTQSAEFSPAQVLARRTAGQSKADHYSCFTQSSLENASSISPQHSRGMLSKSREGLDLKDCDIVISQKQSHGPKRFQPGTGRTQQCVPESCSFGKNWASARKLATSHVNIPSHSLNSCSCDIAVAQSFKEKSFYDCSGKCKFCSKSVHINSYRKHLFNCDIFYKNVVCECPVNCDTIYSNIYSKNMYKKVCKLIKKIATECAYTNSIQYDSGFCSDEIETSSTKETKIQKTRCYDEDLMKEHITSFKAYNENKKFVPEKIKLHEEEITSIKYKLHDVRKEINNFMSEHFEESVMKIIKNIKDFDELIVWFHDYMSRKYPKAMYKISELEDFKVTLCHDSLIKRCNRSKTNGQSVIQLNTRKVLNNACYGRHIFTISSGFEFASKGSFMLPAHIFSGKERNGVFFINDECTKRSWGPFVAKLDNENRSDVMFHGSIIDNSVFDSISFDAIYDGMGYVKIDRGIELYSGYYDERYKCMHGKMIKHENVTYICSGLKASDFEEKCADAIAIPKDHVRVIYTSKCSVCKQYCSDCSCTKDIIKKDIFEEYKCVRCDMDGVQCECKDKLVYKDNMHEQSNHLRSNDPDICLYINNFLTSKKECFDDLKQNNKIELLDINRNENNVLFHTIRSRKTGSTCVINFQNYGFLFPTHVLSPVTELFYLCIHSDAGETIYSGPYGYSQDDLIDDHCCKGVFKITSFAIMSQGGITKPLHHSCKSVRILAEDTTNMMSGSFITNGVMMNRQFRSTDKSVCIFTPYTIVNRKEFTILPFNEGIEWTSGRGTRGRGTQRYYSGFNQNQGGNFQNFQQPGPSGMSRGRSRGNSMRGRVSTTASRGRGQLNVRIPGLSVATPKVAVVTKHMEETTSKKKDTAGTEFEVKTEQCYQVETIVSQIGKKAYESKPEVRVVKLPGAKVSNNVVDKLSKNAEKASKAIFGSTTLIALIIILFIEGTVAHPTTVRPSVQFCDRLSVNLNTIISANKGGLDAATVVRMRTLLTTYTPDSVSQECRRNLININTYFGTLLNMNPAADTTNVLVDVDNCMTELNLCKLTDDQKPLNFRTFEGFDIIIPPHHKLRWLANQDEQFVSGKISSMIASREAIYCLGKKAIVQHILFISSRHNIDIQCKDFHADCRQFCVMKLRSDGAFNLKKYTVGSSCVYRFANNDVDLCTNCGDYEKSLIKYEIDYNVESMFEKLTDGLFICMIKDSDLVEKLRHIIAKQNVIECNYNTEGCFAANYVQLSTEFNHGNYKKFNCIELMHMISEFQLTIKNFTNSLFDCKMLEYEFLGKKPSHAILGDTEVYMWEFVYPDKGPYAMCSNTKKEDKKLCCTKGLHMKIEGVQANQGCHDVNIRKTVEIDLQQSGKVFVTHPTDNYKDSLCVRGNTLVDNDGSVILVVTDELSNIKNPDIRVFDNNVVLRCESRSWCYSEKFTGKIYMPPKFIICENTLEGQSYAITAFATSTGNDAIQKLKDFWNDPLGFMFNIEDGSKYKFYGLKIFKAFTQIGISDIIFLSVMTIMWMTPARIYIWMIFMAYVASKVGYALALDCPTIDTESTFKVLSGTVLLSTENIIIGSCYRITLTDNSNKPISSYTMRINDVKYDVALESAFYVPVEYQIDREHTWSCPGTSATKCSVRSAFNRDGVGIVVRQGQYENGLIDGCFLIGEAHICEVFMLQKLTKAQSMACYKLEDISDRIVEMSFIEENAVNGSSHTKIAHVSSDKWTDIDGKLSIKLSLGSFNKHVVYNFICFDFSTKEMFYTDRTPMRTNVITSFVIDTIPNSGEANLPREYIEINKLTIREVDWKYNKNNKEKFLQQSYFQKVTKDNNRFTYKFENGDISELYYHPRADVIKSEFKTSGGFVNTLKKNCVVDICNVTSVIDLQVVGGNYQHRLNIKCSGYSGESNNTLISFDECRIDSNTLCTASDKNKILSCNPTIACPFNVELFTYKVCGKRNAEKINSTFQIIDAFKVRYNYGSDVIGNYYTSITGWASSFFSSYNMLQKIWIIGVTICACCIFIFVNRLLGILLILIVACAIQAYAFELIDDTPYYWNDFNFHNDSALHIVLNTSLNYLFAIHEVLVVIFVSLNIVWQATYGSSIYRGYCSKLACLIVCKLSNNKFKNIFICIGLGIIAYTPIYKFMFWSNLIPGYLELIIHFFSQFEIKIHLISIVTNFLIIISRNCGSIIVFFIVSNLPHFRSPRNFSGILVYFIVIVEYFKIVSADPKCLYVTGTNIGSNANMIAFKKNQNLMLCAALPENAEIDKKLMSMIRDADYMKTESVAKVCAHEEIIEWYVENGFTKNDFYLNNYLCEHARLKYSESYVVSKATCSYDKTDIVLEVSNVIDFGFEEATIYNSKLGGYCGLFTKWNCQLIYFLSWVLLKFIGDRSLHIGDFFIISQFIYHSAYADTCVYTHGVDGGKRDNQFLYDKGIQYSLHGRWNINITSNNTCISYNEFISKFNGSKLQNYMYSTNENDYPGNCCKFHYHEYTKHFCSNNGLSYSTFVAMLEECLNLGIPGRDIYDCQYCATCNKNLALSTTNLEKLRPQGDCKPGVFWFIAKACVQIFCAAGLSKLTGLPRIYIVLIVMCTLVTGAEASTVEIFNTGIWMSSKILRYKISAAFLGLSLWNFTNLINLKIREENKGQKNKKITKYTKVILKGYSSVKHARRLGLNPFNGLGLLRQHCIEKNLLKEEQKPIVKLSSDDLKEVCAHLDAERTESDGVIKEHTALRMVDPIYNLGESSKFNKLDVKTRLNYVTSYYKNVKKDVDCDLIRKRVDIDYTMIDNVKIAFGASPRINAVMEHLPHIVRISHAGRRKYGFIDTSVDNQNRTLITTTHGGGDRDILTRSVIIGNETVSHGDELCKIKLHFMDAEHDISYYGGPKTKFCTPVLGKKYIVVVPHVVNYRGGEGAFILLEYSKCDIDDKGSKIKTCWRFWDPIVGYYNPVCRQVQGFSGLPIMDEEGRIYGICSTFMTVKNETMYATYQHHAPAEVEPEVNCKQKAYTISKFEPGMMNAVCMPTGTGKTTALPYHMYKDYPRRAGESTANVLVLIPNVCPIENTVPYMQEKYKMNEVYKKNSLGDTRLSEVRGIVYMSYGSWIREKDLAVRCKYFDYIFFDEYHQMDCDVLTAFMMYNKITEDWEADPSLKAMNNGHLPIFVCMTATPPTETPDSINRNKLITTKRLVNASPIQNEFAPECKNKKALDPNCESYNIYGIPVTPSLFTDGMNHLFYLPSKADCDRMSNWMKSKKPHYYINVFYRGCDTSPQELEMKLLSNTTGSIIFATNYIETGVTFDFDICFDTRLRFAPAVNWDENRRQFVRTMDKVEITPASAQQRAGRVGRFKTGTYYYVSDCAETNMSINLEDIFESMVLFKHITKKDRVCRFMWEPFQEYCKQELITFFSDILDCAEMGEKERDIVYDIIYNPLYSRTKNLIPNWVKYINIITKTAAREYAKAYEPVPTKYITNTGLGALQAAHCDEFLRWDAKVSRDAFYRRQTDELMAKVRRKYGNEVYVALNELEMNTKNSLYKQCTTWLERPDLPAEHKRNIVLLMMPHRDIDVEKEAQNQKVEAEINKEHSNDAWMLLFGCAGVSVTALAVNTFLKRSLPSIISCYTIDLDISLDNSNHWDWRSGSDFMTYFSSEVHSVVPFDNNSDETTITNYIEYKEELTENEIQKQLEAYKKMNPAIVDVNYENELNRVATETIAEAREAGAMTEKEKTGLMTSIMTDIEEVKRHIDYCSSTVEHLSNRTDRLTDDENAALQLAEFELEMYNTKFTELQESLAQVTRNKILPDTCDGVNITNDVLECNGLDRKSILVEGRNKTDCVGSNSTKTHSSQMNELDIIKEKIVKTVNNIPHYAGNAYEVTKKYADEAIKNFSEFLNQSKFDSEVQGLVSCLGFTSVACFYDHFRQTIGFFPIAIIMIALSSWTSICLGFIRTAIIMLGSLFLYSVTTKEGNESKGGEIFCLGQLPNLCIWVYQAYCAGNMPLVDSAIAYISNWISTQGPANIAAATAGTVGISAFTSKISGWLTGNSSTAIMNTAISVHKIIMDLYSSDHNHETMWSALSVISSGLIGNFGIMFRGVLIGFIAGIINIVLISKGTLFNLIVKLFCKNVMMQDIQKELERPEVIRKIITFIMYALEIALDPMQLLIVLFSFIGVKVRGEDEKSFADLISENAGMSLIIWIVREARKYSNWIRHSGNIATDFNVKHTSTPAFSDCIDSFTTTVNTLYNSIKSFLKEVPGIYISRSLKWLRRLIDNGIKNMKQWLNFKIAIVTNKISNSVMAPLRNMIVGCNYRHFSKNHVSGDIVMDLESEESKTLINTMLDIEWSYNCNCGERMYGVAKQIWLDEIQDYLFKIEHDKLNYCNNKRFKFDCDDMLSLVQQLPDGTIMKMNFEDEGVFVCKKDESNCMSWLSVLLKSDRGTSKVLQHWPAELIDELQFNTEDLRGDEKLINTIRARRMSTIMNYFFFGETKREHVRFIFTCSMCVNKGIFHTVDIDNREGYLRAIKIRNGGCGALETTLDNFLYISECDETCCTIAVYDDINAIPSIVYGKCYSTKVLETIREPWDPIPRINSSVVTPSLLVSMDITMKDMLTHESNAIEEAGIMTYEFGDLLNWDKLYELNSSMNLHLSNYHFRDVTRIWGPCSYYFSDFDHIIAFNTQMMITMNKVNFPILVVLRDGNAMMVNKNYGTDDTVETLDLICSSKAKSYQLNITTLQTKLPTTARLSTQCYVSMYNQIRGTDVGRELINKVFKGGVSNLDAHIRKFKQENYELSFNWHEFLCKPCSKLYELSVNLGCFKLLSDEVKDQLVANLDEDSRSKSSQLFNWFKSKNRAVSNYIVNSTVQLAVKIKNSDFEEFSADIKNSIKKTLIKIRGNSFDPEDECEYILMDYEEEEVPEIVTEIADDEVSEASEEYVMSEEGAIEEPKGTPFSERLFEYLGIIADGASKIIWYSEEEKAKWERFKNNVNKLSNATKNKVHDISEGLSTAKEIIAEGIKEVGEGVTYTEKLVWPELLPTDKGENYESTMTKSDRYVLERFNNAFSTNFETIYQCAEFVLRYILMAYEGVTSSCLTQTLLYDTRAIHKETVEKVLHLKNEEPFYDNMLANLWDLYVKYCMSYGMDIRMIIGYRNPYVDPESNIDFTCHCMNPTFNYSINKVGLRHQGNCFYEALFIMKYKKHVSDTVINSFKLKIMKAYGDEMSENSRVHYSTAKSWADQETIIWVSKFINTNICIHVYDSAEELTTHQTYEAPGATSTVHIACIDSISFEPMVCLGAIESNYTFELIEKSKGSAICSHDSKQEESLKNRSQFGIMNTIRWANNKTLQWRFDIPWAAFGRGIIDGGRLIKGSVMGKAKGKKLQTLNQIDEEGKKPCVYEESKVAYHHSALQYGIANEIYDYVVSSKRSRVAYSNPKPDKAIEQHSLTGSFSNVIYGVPNVNYHKINVSSLNCKETPFNREQFEECRKIVDEVRHQVNSFTEKFWYVHARDNKMPREEEQLWVSKGAYKMEEMDYQMNIISWGTKHLFVAEGRGGFVQMLMTKIAAHKKAENHKIFIVTSLNKERERPWINAMDIPTNVNYNTIVSINEDGTIIGNNDIQNIGVRKFVEKKIKSSGCDFVDNIYFDGAESARNQKLAADWQEDIFISMAEMCCNTLRLGGSMIIKMCDFFYNYEQIAVLMSMFSNCVFWRSPSSVNCTQEVYMVMRGFKRPKDVEYVKLSDFQNRAKLNLGLNLANKKLDSNPGDNYKQSIIQKMIGSTIKYSHWLKKDRSVVTYKISGASYLRSLNQIMSLSIAYSKLMQYELLNMLNGRPKLASNHCVKPVATEKVKTFRYNKEYRVTNLWHRVKDCDGNIRAVGECSLIPRSETRNMIREFGCFSMKVNGCHYQDRAYEVWSNFMRLYNYRISEDEGYANVKNLKFMGKINLHNHFTKNTFMKLSNCAEIAEMFLGSDISNLPVGFADKTLQGWEECIRKKMDIYHTPQSAHDINSLMACLTAISNYNHEKFDLMPWDQIEKIINKKGAGGWLNDTKLIDIVQSPKGRSEVDKMVNDLMNGIIPPCFMSVNHKTEVRALESDVTDDGTWNPYPKPRAIQFYDGITRLAHFRLFGYFQTMHNLDHKLYWGSNTGRSLVDVGDYLKSQWDKYKKPVCIIGDTKTWDGNMTAEQLVCECESFKPHLKPKLHKALQTCYEIDLAPLCLDLNGKLFFRKAQRGSGVWNTSRGNGKVNVALWVQMISEAIGVSPSWVIENVTICCEGDDIVTIMEEQHSLIVLAYAAKFLKRVNKPPKLVDEDGNIRWTSKFTEIEFCSHTYQPVPIGNKVRFLPHRSLAELLGKFSLTKKSIGTKFGTPESRELNRSKAISYLLLYPGQPILRRLALMVLTKVGWGTFDTKEFKYIFGSIVGATSLMSAVRSVYGYHINNLSDIGYFPYNIIQKDYKNLMSYVGGNFDQGTNFRNLARDYVSSILETTYNNEGIDTISIRRTYTGRELIDVSFLSLDRYLLKIIVRDWRMKKFLLGLNKKQNLYPDIASDLRSDSKTEHLINIFKTAFIPSIDEKIDSSVGDHVARELNLERTRFSFSKGFSLDQFNIAMLTWANQKDVDQLGKNLIILKKIRNARTVLKLTNRVAVWLGLRVSSNLIVSPT